MTAVKKPLVLLILDGFGYSPESTHNAIANADAPTWNDIWKNAPHTLIHTSGMHVGLPDGQMGNSEVGHMTLGAGRVVYQNYTRINKAIADGDFFSNPAYCAAVDKAAGANKAVHILGCLSSGGVHSHQDHIVAAIKLALGRGASKVYLHAFLDGRDTPPRSAESSIQKIESTFADNPQFRFASVIGRFYALDRDKRWDRVKKAFDLMVDGVAEFRSPTALDALKAAYERDENDEFVAATSICGVEQEPITINDGDSILFMNFRPDRARQITNCFVQADFDGFERKRVPALADFVMTTEYAADIDTSCAFPPELLNNTLGEVLEKQGKKQLRIAETEKYAHVTFFFSGGQEATFDGEQRELIPSPKVATYDLKPEMSAYEVTDKLIDAIKSGTYDAIICNYANCDQVGHTGSYEASIKAVEAVDECLAKVFAALESVDGHALVTADHGNVELMFDEGTGQLHTQHTTFPVPLVYVGNEKLTLKSDGSLADIAPTMLALMNIEQPEDMNGRDLVERT